MTAFLYRALGDESGTVVFLLAPDGSFGGSAATTATKATTQASPEVTRWADRPTD